MSVGLILNLLDKSNKKIPVLHEPLVSIISFYVTSSIHLVMNLHESYILFVTYPKKVS